MSGRSGLSRFVSGDARPADARPADAQSAKAQPAETQPPEIQPAMRPADVEKCELCATVIPAAHSHVADLESSSLMCACRACYLLFTHSQAGRGRYRAVPDRYLTDPGDLISASEWDTLDIPVGLAFFLRDSASDQVVGFYPSPAGATECRLDLDAWQHLAAGHALLGEAAADVEAVLIARSESVIECFIVPIDACYELAGRMRLHWRGFDGGSEARASIAAFLDTVRAQARPFRRDAGRSGA